MVLHFTRGFVHDDDDFDRAGLGKRQEDALDECLSADSHERLQRVRDVPEPLTPAGGNDPRAP